MAQGLGTFWRFPSVLVLLAQCKRAFSRHQELCLACTSVAPVTSTHLKQLFVVAEYVAFNRFSYLDDPRP